MPSLTVSRCHVVVGPTCLLQHVLTAWVSIDDVINLGSQTALFLRDSSVTLHVAPGLKEFPE